MPINYERLERTAQVLEEVAAKKSPFDLRTFFGPAYYVRDLETAEKTQLIFDDKGTEWVLIPHKCATTACAVGYAGLNPWFHQEGLVTQPSGVMHYKGIDQRDGNEIECEGWDVIDAFYGFEYVERNYESFTAGVYLFVPDAYIEEDANPLGVAQRIRDFIERQGEIPAWFDPSINYQYQGDYE